MSRASPAISDADSRDSSQNTCSTEDSSVTYNPRGRTSSSARSTSTEITKASGTSEGTSYLTVETTKTETENRSWFEQFWAWYLSDDKQDSNRVEERQEKNLKDDDSADCEVASRASECSQASDLITEDGSQIYGLQGSVKYDEHTHLTNKKCDDEKVFLFGEFEEQDVDKDDDKPLDAIARHSSFVRQPRESPRPFTPRHRTEEQSRLGESQLLTKRNESPSPSPSPVISTIQMRSSKSSTLAEGKDERQDERSMSRGETNEQPEKKRELPPRPHSSFVFRPRPLLSAMKRNRSLGPSNLVDETNLKQSDSHNSTTSTSRHNSSTPHQVSHIRLEKVEGKIPKKASVQERIQTFEAAPLGIMTDESTIDREEPDFTLNKDEKKKDSSSTLRTNEKAKNSPVALTMNEREGHSPIDGSSRFGIRSLGARKRFGTPVFFRAASFDGVLTLDSSPSHISREVRNNSTSIVNGK